MHGFAHEPENCCRSHCKAGRGSFRHSKCCKTKSASFIYFCPPQNASTEVMDIKLSMCALMSVALKWNVANHVPVQSYRRQHTPFNGPKEGVSFEHNRATCFFILGATRAKICRVQIILCPLVSDGISVFHPKHRQAI